MPTKSHGLLDQVDTLIDHARRAPQGLPNGEGDYIQALLVRYGCVLTCAAIEQAVAEVGTHYATKAGDGRLLNFVSEALRYGRNPTPAYIKEALGRFDREWAARIEVFMQEIGVDQISSIVSNRNRIAHGEQVSFGVVSLTQWLSAARKLCHELVKLTAESRPIRMS